MLFRTCRRKKITTSLQASLRSASQPVNAAVTSDRRPTMESFRVPVTFTSLFRFVRSSSISQHLARVSPDVVRDQRREAHVVVAVVVVVFDRSANNPYMETTNPEPWNWIYNHHNSPPFLHTYRRNQLIQNKKRNQILWFQICRRNKTEIDCFRREIVLEGRLCFRREIMFFVVG